MLKPENPLNSLVLIWTIILVSNWKYSETTGEEVQVALQKSLMPDQVQNSSFKLRPQPTSDWVELELNIQNDANCYVYNMLGVCCSVQKAKWHEFKINLNNKNFSDGNYFSSRWLKKNGTSSSGY